MANGFGYQVNPVEPTSGQGLAVGLTGLADTLQHVREEKAAQAARQKAQEEVMAAYESEDPDAVAAALINNPQYREQLGGAIDFRNEATKKNFTDTARTVLANRGNPEAALQALDQRIEAVRAAGGDPSESIEARQELAEAIFSERGDTEPFFKATELAFSSIAPQEWEAYQAAKGIGPGAMTAAIQNREDLLRRLEDSTLTEDQKQAIRVEAGIVPRAGTSAAERIAEEDKTEDVAESQAAIEGAKAGAKERAKLEQQGMLLPTIRANIKLAETEAKARGEKFTRLNQAEAALPGIKEVANQLRELAPKVTHTIAGRTFDTLAKELGFGATEGGTARARMIALIDNQILPLLRPIFGAQFTEREGEALKKTLGDPNATPEAKLAQINSFVEQMERNIEDQRREAVGLEGGAEEEVSIEDLINKYASPQ